MSRNPDEPAFRRTGHNGQPRGRQAGATAGHMITTTTTSRSHRRARDAAGNHQKLDVSKHSSKKITKTQQASGRLSAQRRLVGRAVILGLVALGAGFVTFSATGHDGDANFGGPLIGDDIHAADGVLACDTFGAPFVAVAVATAEVAFSSSTRSPRSPLVTTRASQRAPRRPASSSATSPAPPEPRT